MRNSPDDLANQLIQKVKDYLQEEVDNTDSGDLSIDMFPDDAIVFGRKELAESLLNQINKWENEFDI
jgi:hypothetical protein